MGSANNDKSADNDVIGILNQIKAQVSTSDKPKLECAFSEKRLLENISKIEDDYMELELSFHQ